MEEFHLDIVIGKGPGARTLRLPLPRFTLIGATTRQGRLSSPLRDRFGATYRLDLFDAPSLVKVVKRSARILGVEVADEAAHEIARRARGTPRIANRLLKRVRDFAQVRHVGRVTLAIAKEALGALEVDEHGLDDLERELQRAIVENQLVLHYQPIVSMRDRTPVAVEALVRWRHPTRGILPPSQFIAAIERAGLARDLTLWVLREAIIQSAVWKRDR